ncbi:MAG TPA: TauD/TfdA family dioxygenase [Acidimicrobiales bacterium]|nr:TauD/TfdA family dioxygenase [Acidimicrobiales bacterium]
MLDEAVQGEAAWRGADLQDSESWIVRFSDDELDEIERALVTVRDHRLDELQSGEFSIPALSEHLREVYRTLQEGRGFVLLRGLPVHERFSEDDAAKVLWAIGCQLGTPVSQNKRGEILGHLQNKVVPGAFERRFSTNESMDFHSDNTDFVGLMCLTPARFGGESLLASTMEAYNIVLAEHPEFLPTLYKYFAKDRMSEQAPGEPGWEMLPLFCYEDGYLSGTTSTAWFVRSMRFADVARLSADEMSCFLFLESLPKRPGMALSMTLEPGDMQFVNNFVLTHTRTGFVDDPDDPLHQRHLLRLWLSHFEGGRPICDAFARGRAGIQPLAGAGV